jgi:phosphatidylinositol alpha-1,6-mannosyltransferase
VNNSSDQKHATFPRSQESNRIVGLFPELLGVGGVQEAGRQTAAALDEIARRRGWSLDLLSLNEPPGAGALRFQGREIPFTGFGRAKVQFVMAAMGLALKDAPIVLAAHPYLAIPARLMKMRSNGSKTIVMSHGIEVWNSLPFLRRRALLQADVLLAPSSDTARKLVEIQTAPAEKIRRLPWPVNSEILQFADSPASLPLPPTFPAGPVILTVGRWAASERYKGADDLIEAIAQLREAIPNVQLVVVGGGDDLPRLRRLAADRGAGDRVTFFQGLSRDQLAACYARCDIFALPSTGEGFGIVFLEAMAFGKPVVGADSGGIPDLIENNLNGLLIPPRDLESLVAALKGLLHDATLRTQLGARGAERVRGEYTFASFAMNLEQIIANALMDSAESK